MRIEGTQEFYVDPVGSRSLIKQSGCVAEAAAAIVPAELGMDQSRRALCFFSSIITAI